MIPRFCIHLIILLLFFFVSERLIVFKSSSISAIASTVHPPHLVACVAVSPKRLRTTSLRLPRRSFVRQYTLHWPDRTAPPCVSAGKCHLHSWKQSAEISLWKTSTSVFYFYIKKKNTLYAVQNIWNIFVSISSLFMKSEVWLWWPNLLLLLCHPWVFRYKYVYYTHFLDALAILLL